MGHFGIATTQPEQHRSDYPGVEHAPIVSSPHGPRCVATRASNDGQVSSFSLDVAADELYASPREDFVALRKRLARAARDADDPDTAAEIEKLAKPTTAAWLANHLARTDPDEVGALVGLGEALRKAHAELAGPRLKALTQQRTELVQDLVRRAAVGNSLSEAVTRELEEIFTAAVANEQVGRALVAGRLTSAKGFVLTPGWPSLSTGGTSPARDIDAGRRRPTGVPTGSGDKLAQARQNLEEARAAVKEAEVARAEEERALGEAERAADEAAAEVTRLTELLDAAEAQEKRALAQAARARRMVKEAERRASHAWRQVQAAERKVAELGE